MVQTGALSPSGVSSGLLLIRGQPGTADSGLAVPVPNPLDFLCWVVLPGKPTGDRFRVVHVPLGFAVTCPPPFGPLGLKVHSQSLGTAACSASAYFPRLRQRTYEDPHSAPSPAPAGRLRVTSGVTGVAPRRAPVRC
jgi:hypothetical protein